MTLQIHIMGIDDDGNQIDELFTEDQIDDAIQLLQDLYLNSSSL